MLEKADIVPLMLEACPGATQAWQEHLEIWEGEEAGGFNDIAIFSRYMLDCYEQGNTEEIDAAFAMIEKLIVEGNDDVRAIAVTGFLENIQNAASHTDYGYSVFEPYLRPTSRRGWEELIVLWEGKSTLADVIRAQKQRGA